MEPSEKLIFENDNDTFNIGADKAYRILDVAKIVQKISIENGFNVDLEFLEERHEAKFAYCDHKKAKEKLDFVDKTDLEKLISEMFHWAIEEPNRQVINMEYEIEKNIYNFWK